MTGSLIGPGPASLSTFWVWCRERRIARLRRRWASNFCFRAGACPLCAGGLAGFDRLRNAQGSAYALGTMCRNAGVGSRLDSKRLLKRSAGAERSVGALQKR